MSLLSTFATYLSASLRSRGIRKIIPNLTQHRAQPAVSSTSRSARSTNHLTATPSVLGYDTSDGVRQNTDIVMLDGDDSKTATPTHRHSPQPVSLRPQSSTKDRLHPTVHSVVDSKIQISAVQEHDTSIETEFRDLRNKLHSLHNQALLERVKHFGHFPIWSKQWQRSQCCQCGSLVLRAFAPRCAQCGHEVNRACCEKNYNIPSVLVPGRYFY